MIFAFGAVACFFGLTGACFLFHGDGSSSIMDSPPKFVLSSLSYPGRSLSFVLPTTLFSFYLFFFLFSVSFVVFCSRLRFRFSSVSFLYDIPVLERETHLRYISSILFFTVSSHAEMLVVSFIIPGLSLGQFHRLDEDDTICHDVVVEYPDTEKFKQWSVLCVTTS